MRTMMHCRKLTGGNTNKLTMNTHPLIRKLTSIKEARLAFYVLSLYLTFMLWGYLQEKMYIQDYLCSVDEMNFTSRWNYPFLLNFFMCAAAAISASVVDYLTAPKDDEKKPSKFKYFWKVSLSTCIASPIGYESLKYISFPMMILSKSSKHVPVMIMGRILYNQNYTWFKYLSVALICSGISLFSVAKHKVQTDSSDIDSSDWTRTLYGLFLILVNLSLDGITSNEQDQIFNKHSVRSTQMMKYNNSWQLIYIIIYLFLNWMILGANSDFTQGSLMITYCDSFKKDIFLFCLCGSLGQILLFGLIREFGSLIWVTVNVTRQLFTIILSVFLFNHHINIWQWTGIAIVFLGLSLEIYFNYQKKERPTVYNRSDSNMMYNLKESASYRKLSD